MAFPGRPRKPVPQAVRDVMLRSADEGEQTIAYSLDDKMALFDAATDAEETDTHVVFLGVDEVTGKAWRVRILKFPPAVDDILSTSVANMAGNS